MKPRPPRLTPFDAEKQLLYSELTPDGQAFHPISMAEFPKETYFNCLYPHPYFFGH